MWNSATFDNVVSASVSVRDNMARAVAKAASGTQHATATAGTLVKDGKTYDGEYIALPTDHPQVFGTKGYLMRDDFTVTEIMLHEAANSFGTTITIGE